MRIQQVATDISLLVWGFWLFTPCFTGKLIININNLKIKIALVEFWVLSFSYLKDSYKEYLDGIVSQLSGDRPPVENSEFSAVGARGWRYSLRDYSNSVPVCLSVDLDAALAEIDAVEFDASRIVTNLRFLGYFLTFSRICKILFKFNWTILSSPKIYCFGKLLFL